MAHPALVKFAWATIGVGLVHILSLLLGISSAETDGMLRHAMASMGLFLAYFVVRDRG